MFIAFFMFLSLLYDVTDVSGLLFSTFNGTLLALTVPVRRAALSAKCPPPGGIFFCGDSLLSEGIPSAFSVGAQLDCIMAISGHTSDYTVRKHYLNTAVEQCLDAEMFFHHLRRRS